MTPLGPLDQAIGLALAPGEEVLVVGAVRTSFDGAVFDAASRTDRLADGTTYAHPDGLFDLAGGGLRVVGHDPATHAVRLAATGAEGFACRAAGVSSPCLAPKTRELAHERLLTAREFEATLSGQIQVDAVLPPAPASGAAPARDFLPLVGLGFAALGVLAFALRFARVRAASPLTAVHSAARAARRATRRDPTLAEVRAQIERLVMRARDLDSTRRACEIRRARIDRAALARGLDAERAAAAKIDEDLTAAAAQIERIASALRLVALRAREHEQEVRVRLGDDPVDQVEAELALRDEALAELEQVA